ncbi:MAG: galactokinase family protein [Candidatus Korobacteraceae bacterium]|jgi:L-arabinokinase
MTQFESTVSRLMQAQTLFSASRPVYISRAPGRLDLMGGNVDYTGGLVFQATIREATWAAAQLRNDDRIVFWNPQMKGEGWLDRVEFDFSSLTDEAQTRQQANRNQQIGWTAYVLGVFYLLRNKFPEQVISGASIYLHSEVPLNKGVSSSAAVEVATMKAAAAAYGIALQGIELAEMCQWVENVIAQSACGIMDQVASVLGDEGFVLPLLCQPCNPQPLVKLPQGLRCWAIDSGVRHAVTGIEYEAARAAAFVGYRMICDKEHLHFTLNESSRIPRFAEPRWNGYVSNISPSVFRSRYESELPLLISGEEILSLNTTHIDPFTSIRPDVNYRVRACTRYAIEENQRIEMFVELARSSNSENAFRLMGDLMFQSHWSYSECGLGCEATDLLVDLVREECASGMLYGAKVTGGGGGGTVAVLGAEDGDESFRRVVEKYAEVRQFPPYVFEGSSIGADRFGIRVIGADS